MPTFRTITGSFQARRDAANSYKRMLKAGLPSGGINSAYRSVAEQEGLFFSRYTVQWWGVGPYGDVRWYKGIRYVRTSGLGMVAIPGTSNHTAGTALDVSTSSDAQAWLLKHGWKFGWRQTISSEPWHWEYAPGRDRDAVLPVQRAVRVRESGKWDWYTTRGIRAVRAASTYAGKRYPFSLPFALKRIGGDADDKWGAADNKAHDHTVAQLIRALRRLEVNVGPIRTTWDARLDKAIKTAKNRY